MTRRGRHACAAAAAAAAATLSAGQPAYATTGTGADISWPQCGTAFPAAAFGIVGVNGETFAKINPCLSEEWQWAVGLGQQPQAYVLAADPGPGGTFWTGQGPEACDPSTLTAACAYDYGWQGAGNALTSMATLQTQPTFYWVDIEPAETWQQDPRLNVAEIHGELNALTARSDLVSGVGIYSSPADFAAITGNNASFGALPVWISSGGCGGPSLMGTAVTQAQTVGTTDTDAVCGPRLPSGVKAQITRTKTVSGTAEPNATVTVTVTSLTHVRLATVTAHTTNTGHWNATVPFTQDASVTATDANGSAKQDLRPVAEVHIAKVRTSNCTAKVSGTVAVAWRGETVQLRSGHQTVAKGGVAGSGTWTLTVRNACGLKVTPYVDGRAGKNKRTEPSTSTKKTSL